MKPILMFVAGAIIAAGLVFFTMRSRPPEPTPVAQVQTPAPEPEVTPPATPPEPMNQPEATPPVEPQRVPPRERAVVPPRSRQTAAAPAASSRPSQPSQAPAASAPAQPAAPATSTPAAQPTGPMIPIEPQRLPPPDAVRTAAEEKKPEPRQPKTVTIPAGTLLSVRVDENLRSDRNQSGESFRASLDQPLVVDGFVIAERGARIEGRIAEADAGGRVRGVSHLALELVRLTTSDGQRVKLTTESFAKQGEKNTKRDAAKVGAAAGIGAAIGAIAGGGKGAAIGAGIGGAAGAGGVMATRGEAAEVKAETRLSFRLREPITITEKL